MTYNPVIKDVFCQNDPWECDGITQLPGWYFWDESGDWHGPFDSKEEAEDLYKIYHEHL